jgi:pimeloyl-ACP methyl ester carboxylesterase
MPLAPTNGIELAYETLGSPESPAILLLNPNGSQLTNWPPSLTNGLVEAGFYVILSDHRDVGLSTKFDAAGAPDFAAIAEGDASSVPYRLEDMADDAAGLLDALEVGQAHVFGGSLGGGVAQMMAHRHPARVTSLISAMSSSSDPSLPSGDPKVWEVYVSPLPEEHEALVAQVVLMWKMFEGSKHGASEAYLRDRAERGIARNHYPVGAMRQAAASMVTGPRTEMLGKLDVPTLVIHGNEDPLVPLAAGEHVASLVPGARLQVVDGMGHEITPDLGPIIVGLVVEFTGALK